MELTVLTLSFTLLLLLGVPVAFAIGLSSVATIVVAGLPVVIAGVLIVLFSIEHVIALLRGEEVEPAWN